MAMSQPQVTCEPTGSEVASLHVLPPGSCTSTILWTEQHVKSREPGEGLGRHHPNPAPGNQATRQIGPQALESPQMTCVSSVHTSGRNRESHSTSILVLSHGSKPHGSKSGPTPQRLHPAMRDPCPRVVSCTKGPMILKSHSPIISTLERRQHPYHDATADRPLSSHITARRLEPVYHVRCRK